MAHFGKAESGSTRKEWKRLHCGCDWQCLWRRLFHVAVSFQAIFPLCTHHSSGYSSLFKILFFSSPFFLFLTLSPSFLFIIAFYAHLPPHCIFFSFSSSSCIQFLFRFLRFAFFLSSFFFAYTNSVFLGGRGRITIILLPTLREFLLERFVLK